MKSFKPKILVIAGPTASGKTDVAFFLSKRLPAKIISADSMQVYRGMEILSGASKKAELTSCLSPSQEFSAAIFRKKAAGLIDKILKEAKTPVIVGGTGLYLRALLDGLFEDQKGAGRDEALRKKFEALEKRHGKGYLHRRLSKSDPVSAGKIHPNDTRRVIRALEVYETTRKRLSEQKPRRQGIRQKYDVRFFLLERDRAKLYERIERRVDEMMKRGLVAEVKKLLRKHLSRTASMALGVREVGAYLRGEISRKEAARRLKQNTRRYAKRQLSWFRHEKDAEKVFVEEGESAMVTANKIVERLEKGEEGPTTFLRDREAIDPVT